MPATIEEAVSQLDGLGALLTAKHWERAAIVFTFAAPGRDGPRLGSSAQLSFREFSELESYGLKSHHSVEKYWQLWEEHGDTTIQPGSKVTLPTIKWPPEAKNLGSRMPKDLGTAVDRLVKEHGQDAVSKEIDDRFWQKRGVDPKAPVASDEMGKEWSKTFRFYHGTLSSTIVRLRQALNELRDMGDVGELSDLDQDLVRIDLGKIRALLDLMEAHATGEVNVDWDAALAKLTEGSDA
jgi:hypothetical protein